MKNANRQALKETLKSMARAAWFALLGLAAVALTAFASSASISTSYVVIGNVGINVAYVIVAVVGFITKAIDVYIHNNQEIKSNGIAPSFLQK